MQPPAWQSSSGMRLWRLRGPFCTDSTPVSRTVLITVSFAMTVAKKAVMMGAEPCHSPSCSALHDRAAHAG